MAIRRTASKWDNRVLIFLVVCALFQFILLLSINVFTKEQRKKEVNEKLAKIHLNMVHLADMGRNVITTNFDFPYFCANASPSHSNLTTKEAYARFENVLDDGGAAVVVHFITVVKEKGWKFFTFLSSAHLAGVPVEVIELPVQDTEHTTITPQELVLSYIRTKAMNDTDVLVLLDDRALFTGQDLFPLLTEYVLRSPASSTALQPQNIRVTRDQVSPILFPASSFCEDGDATGLQCIKQYETVVKEVMEYVKLRGFQVLSAKSRFEGKNKFLSGSSFIGRVWALKMAFTALHRNGSGNSPIPGKLTFASLFLDLLKWEVTADQWRNTAEGALSPCGIPAGLLGLDYTSRIFGVYQPSRGLLLEYNKNLLVEDSDLTTLRTGTVRDMREGRISFNYTAVGAPMSLSFLSFASPTENTAKPEKGKTIETGFPPSDGHAPPLWLFGGDGWRKRFEAMLEILPTRIVLDAKTERREESKQVFWHAPHHRTWSVSHHAKENSSSAVYVIRPAINITSESLCALLR